MDLGPQLLQLLLVRDAEMLLLVDDHQAQILELHALAEERVGADDDVDLAVGQALLDLVRLLGRHEPRQLCYPDRQPLEPAGEQPEMLAHQQRGRRQQRHLLAGQGRHEGRAQRHLGLAETDIAADQPVHRPAAAHVLEHGLDRRQLVLGLLVGEAGGELLVDAGRQVQDRALAQQPLGRDLDQLAGQLADPLLDLGLARLPADAAQPVQHHLLVGMAVARQHVEILDRHEQLVAAVVDQLEAIVRRAADLERLQPLEPADAMLGMHHGVALAQRRRCPG